MKHYAIDQWVDFSRGLSGAEEAQMRAHLESGCPTCRELSEFTGKLSAVCASLAEASVPESVGNSADGFKRASDQYNTWGEQAQKMGLKFGFHDHDTEFKVFGGLTGFDLLMQYTDPKLVQWQMDCYWVTQAGRDPVTLFKKYGSRMQSLHLKDRKPNVPTSTDTGPGSQHFAEVGMGTLDWPHILQLAEQFHVPNMYVEQDITERPPLESLQISYTNLMKYLNA